MHMYLISDHTHFELRGTKEGCSCHKIQLNIDVLLSWKASVLCYGVNCGRAIVFLGIVTKAAVWWSQIRKLGIDSYKRSSK